MNQTGVLQASAPSPLLLLLAAAALSDAAASLVAASQRVADLCAQVDGDDAHSDASSDESMSAASSTSTDCEADSGSEAEATALAVEPLAGHEFERFSREKRALCKPPGPVRDGVCPCDQVQLPADLSQLARETWAHFEFPQPRGTLINSGTNQQGDHWYEFIYRGHKELLYENKPRPETGVRSTWMRRGDGTCFYKETPGQLAHAHPHSPARSQLQRMSY